MNTQEIEEAIRNRIEARRPIFKAEDKGREVEFEVFSHFGRAFMGLLVTEKNIPINKVEEFAKTGMCAIDLSLKADLVTDRDTKEMRATLSLGMQEIGDNFPDLMFAALQAEWSRVDGE